MKILLLGDFGGKFSDAILADICSKDFDIVLCNGDYGSLIELRRLFFRHGNNFQEMVSRPELESWTRKALRSAKPVLKRLDSLGKPCYVVAGNAESRKKKEFREIVNSTKNLLFLDSSPIMFRDFLLFGYNHPMNKISNDKQLFRKLLHLPTEKIIFLTHYPPFDCKLDLLSETNPINPGQHVGSRVVKGMIERFKPSIVVCGHIEEYQESCFIGSTLVINPGPAAEGKYAILEGKNVEFFTAE